MAFKTFADSDALTASEVNTYLMAQAWNICTSGTRPTGADGRVIYETDTDKVYVYNGSAWCEVLRTGAWSTWTYSIGGIVKSSGTSTGEFVRLGGRTIHMWFRYTLGSGALSVSGPASLELPVAAGNYIGSQFSGRMIDDSTGANFEGLVVPSGSTTVLMYVNDTAGSYSTSANPSTTVPFSWTTSDRWEISGTYQAAAS